LWGEVLSDCIAEFAQFQAAVCYFLRIWVKVGISRKERTRKKRTRKKRNGKKRNQESRW